MNIEHSTDIPKLSFGLAKRLPVILQSEASECGLACLAMIASYHGSAVTLSVLRARHAVSLKGMTLASLLQIAQTLGLNGRPIKLELNELEHLRLPCILHWDFKHFVVLKSIRRGKATIHDPARGERVLPLEEIGSRFTGVALELSPCANFQRQRRDPQLTLRGVIGTVNGLRRSLLHVLGMALALELCVLLAPLFTQLLVDQVLADGDHDLLTMLGIGFTVLLILQLTIGAIRTWTVAWLGAHFNIAWTANVFRHLMKLPHDFFMKRHLGDVISRFSAITSIQQTLTSRFVEAILDGLMTIVTAVMMAVYSPLLASITVASVLIYGVLRALYYQTFRAENLSQIVLQAKQQSCFMEAARGIQTIQLNNQSAAQSSRYLNTVTDALNCNMKIQKLNVLFDGAAAFTSGMQRISVLWVGAWLALKGGLSAGMLMAYVSYSDQFAQRGSTLINYLNELRMLRLQTDRLADIVLTPPERFAQGSYLGEQPLGSLALRQISFRYADAEPWILRNASLTVKQGESLAVIGPSGSGKSTTALLMLGLLDPILGDIEIGGVDVRRLGKDRLRAMTAAVLQTDTLFAGTIADNISLFDHDATLDDVSNAARIANIHQDIQQMPMGYHTLVGDMGSALSGGQKQRVLLARALFRKPRILVLDEATSHLDVVSERHVSQAIHDLAITRIIIAHRPETIASADRVVALQGGIFHEVRGTAAADGSVAHPGVVA